MKRFYGSAFFGFMMTAICAGIRYRLHPSHGPLLFIENVGLWPVTLLRLVALRPSGTTSADLSLYSIFGETALLLDIVGIIIATAFYSGIAYAILPEEKQRRR